MNKRSVVRSVILFIFISISVVFLTFFLMKKFVCTSEAVQEGDHVDLQEEKESPAVTVITDKVKAKKPVNKSSKTVKNEKLKKTAGFKNNAEIRQEYGKIETVYLFSGEVYTGAVIQNDSEQYTLVTVSGVMHIPMSEVKMRNIIR